MLIVLLDGPGFTAVSGNRENECIQQTNLGVCAKRISFESLVKINEFALSNSNPPFDLFGVIKLFRTGSTQVHKIFNLLNIFSI